LAAGPANGEAAYPEQLRDLVEDYLRALAFTGEDDVEGLREAMRYSLLAGGKRIRPVLALATAEAIGHEPSSVLALAAALELIHTYSLIHDDLPAMDDDDLRRGRPTCHRVYGVGVAILAGDALYAEAFHHLLSQQRGDPAKVLAAAATLAGATGVGGMVGGQYLDVSERSSRGPEGLRRLHELKTGRLIAASVVCVPQILGSREHETISWFGTYAGELGVLFQIVDDILDVTGSRDTLGKAQGSDERLGKRTYVSEFGLGRARELATQSHTRAREALRLAAPAGAPHLEQITDFIATRSH
jgi:geranylgeranyl diphosphate synthase type II